MKSKKYKELSKLKGLIREKKTTYQKISKSIGMCNASVFSNKINGYSVFNLNEVILLAKELDIDSSKISEYFF